MQQINLYQDQFRTRREPWNARALAGALGLLVLVLAAVSAWLQFAAVEAAAELAAAEQRRDRVEQRVLALRSQLEQIEAGESVRADLPTRLRAELAAKRRLMDYLEEGPLARRDGFSGHLQGLARRVVDDLWFDRIVLEHGGDRLRFEGHSLEAAHVPRMIAALGEEAVFAGHAFRSLVIERPEDADWRVDFLLASDLLAADGKRGGLLMELRDRLRRLETAIDARALRERLLLAGAIAVVLLLAWDALVRAPLSGRIATAEQRIEQLEREAVALEATGADLEQRLRAGGGGDATAAVLREQIDRVDDALAERTARVISPRQMVAVLRDMLEQAPGLKLMALRNRGSEPVITEPKDGDGQVPRVFRHRVEVVLRGEYFALQDYLQRLEGLEWQFQWDGLALETVDYPQAEATVSISTLSLAEDWVGV